MIVLGPMQVLVTAEAIQQIQDALADHLILLPDRLPLDE